MYRSPSRLPEESRRRIVAALNQGLADGLDLHSQIKVAHWNVKGPLFAALHPTFETFAVGLSGFNDEIAERAVTLGGHVYGTLRHAAQVSRLAEYDQEARRDLDHVRLLAERFDAYVQGLREVRAVGEKEGDTDTVDLLTGVISAFEKHAWFLRASLEA
jgi:starvation-inducible DNA-binding protein